MSKNIESLSSLLDILLITNKAHICIHDISGILGASNMYIDLNYKTHSKPFCDAAKCTARGYRLCLFCKMQANRKAVEEKRMFSGYCPYGLYEIACPVEVSGEVLAIVYVGNLLINRSESKRRIKTACRATGAPESTLNRLLNQAQSVLHPEDFEKMAEFVASYIKKLYITKGESVRKSDMHWAVEIAAEYILHNYEKNITLKEVAKLHFINEKYLGQLFRKQLGISFTSYLNNTRLEHAKSMLVSTKDSVIDVSTACGYQNVTYFNRIFKKVTGKTPTDYRIEMTD